MPKKFSTKQEQDIRTRIMDEATRLCASAGLKHCTVDLLCGYAGISKGSFYRFFSSKEELEEACLSHAGQQIQQRLCRIISDDRIPPDDAVSQVFGMLLHMRPIGGVHMTSEAVISAMHEKGCVCDFSTQAFEQLLDLLYHADCPENSGSELLSEILRIGVSAYIRD